MANFDSNYGRRDSYMQVVVNPRSPNVSANTTIVDWEVWVYTGVTYWQGIAQASNLYIDGGASLWSVSRSDTYAARTWYKIGTGSKTIAHNANGTKTISISARLSVEAGGGGPGNLTISTSMALPSIPRKPATPSIDSIDLITDTGGRAHWTRGGIMIDQISWRISSGAWQTSSSSATSGSFSFGGLSPGKAYTAELQTRSSASGLWSSSATKSFTTLNRSYISGASFSPVSGHYDRVLASYTTSQSGGTTEVQYKVDSGYWFVMPANKIITGLAEGGGYTIYLRVKNSSGLYSGEISAWVRTHTRPSGNLSLSQTNRTTMRVSSSELTNTTLTQYRVKVGAGGWGVWITFSGSATFSVNPSTQYSVEMNLYSSTTELSSFRSASITSNDVSSLSGISFSPRTGTDDQINVAYSSSQTGGTTAVHYNIDGGTWHVIPSSKIFTGLSPGRQYAFRLRAVNSSGEINEYGPYNATPNVKPSGRFSLSQSNKTSVTITSSALANATGTRYKVDGGSWIDFSGSATISANPGQRYAFSMQIYNNTTGLTVTTGVEYITVIGLAYASLISKTTNLRNRATISIAFANTPITSYEWRLDSGNWATITNSEANQYLELNNLTSNTTYTVSVRANDSLSGRTGPEKTYSFTTADFLEPLVSYERNLTSILATYTFRDSGFMVSNYQNLEFINKVYKTGETINLRFTLDKFKSAFKHDTEYLITSVFKDEYSAKNSVIEASIRTLSIPVPLITLPTRDTIRSVDQRIDRPIIKAVFPSEKYSKKIVLNMKDSSPIVSREITVAENMSSGQYELVYDDLVELIKKTTSTITFISGEVFYTEGGRTSPSTHKFTVTLPLENSLLIMPSSSEIILDYTPAAGVSLNELLNYGINKVLVKTPKIQPVFGGTISSITYNFNGENHTESEKHDGSTESYFGPYKNSIRDRTVTVTAQDSRGLINKVTKQIAYSDYIPPVLEVRDVERKGGFGKDLQALGVNISYFRPALKVGSEPNRITSLAVNYYIANSDYLNYYGELMDLNLINHDIFGMDIELSSDQPGTQDLFLENQSYRLVFSMTDSLSSSANVVARAGEFIVPTGRPLMFIDEYNSQIGVGTTNPLGELHVNGSFYSNKSYSMNGFFFLEEDLEDI